jgi:hypothetical protein
MPSLQAIGGVCRRAGGDGHRVGCQGRRAVAATVAVTAAALVAKVASVEDEE